MSARKGSTQPGVADSATHETFSKAAVGGICVADGAGLSIRVERDHLVVADGIGRQRREQRFHRATHGLSRIVVLGSSGTVSLDALRYCDRLGIPLVVMDPMAPRLLFSSTPKGTVDARVTRVQARAVDSEVGLDLTRQLLGAKLSGQAENLGRFFGETSTASSIATLAEALKDVSTLDELRQLEASAAAGYFHVWAGSPLCVPRFATRDGGKIPLHWLRYDGRSFVLKGSHQNRKAERPVNALLNYLFSLLEAETTLACLRVGIDPSLGVLHADQAGRDSMALDLMEPVRPAVEAWTLELLEKRVFSKSDFFEAPDGHVRLLAPLTHELASTMGLWRRLVSPWVERTLHLFGEVVRGRWVATTPLTLDKTRQAQMRVRARKAEDTLLASFAGLDSHPRQGVQEASMRLSRCVQCGGPTLRGQHQRCPQCWEDIPDQEISVRRRRGVAISLAKRETSAWRSTHPRGNVEWYLREVLPKLEGVPLRVIVEATEMSKSMASVVRAGKRVPAERLWEALSRLG